MYTYCPKIIQANIFYVKIKSFKNIPISKLIESSKKRRVKLYETHTGNGRFKTYTAINTNNKSKIKNYFIRIV